MRPFEHMSVSSVGDAVTALSEGGDQATVIAGGVELLSLMKASLAAPARVINLKPARDLRGVTALPDGSVRLGALTTLAEIERDPTLAERAPILRAAVRDAATPQLRNMATIGGNLLQRNRCWYFRDNRPCWLNGGDTCFAREGQNKYHAIFQESPCVAVHPSDLAPALVALDARVVIAGQGAEREQPVAELIQPPAADRRRETTLEQGEVITAVIIPPQPEGARGVYIKMMDRHAWAYALVSAAAQLAVTDGVVTHARVVLGGVANTPRRLTAVEDALRGQRLTSDLAAQAAEHAITGAQALSHNAYKVPLARELTRRAILQAAGMDW